MADLVITAASVVAGSNAMKDTGTAGEAITAGQTVYKASTGLYMLADSNSATAAAKEALGVALHAAAVNQPLTIQKKGAVTIGATLTPGLDYYVSDTPGGICPRADLASGEAVCQLGLAASATVLNLDVQFPGVTL
jgi:hypothetical protein